MNHKKLLSLFLTAVLIFSLLTANMISVFAKESEKNISLGATALKGAQQSNVYFGTYQQSNIGTPTTVQVGSITDTTATRNNQGPYYAVEPVKWRVLDTSFDLSATEMGIFLLSDQTIDAQRYNSKAQNTTWESSTIRSWLNGYDGASSGQTNSQKTDYSKSNFINSVFSASEKNAVADTSITSGKNPKYNTNYGNSTVDKVFLLSIDEVQNKSYGFTSDGKSTSTRIATKTAYTCGKGYDAPGDADYWLLRSPGKVAKHCTYVSFDGTINYYGDYVNIEDLSVRPAFNLKTSSILFTSAAKGGKSRSATSNGVTGIFKNRSYSSNNYKLTLLDENRSAFTANVKSISGNNLTVAYSGAKTGKNEYISVIIKNGNDVKYYGRIAAVSSSYGDVNITLPDDFNITNGDSLCVFNEQYNGDYLTDFSSNLIDVFPFTYTVKFDANGGNGSLSPQTMTSNVASNLSANVFTKSGYQFNGWNTKSDGSGTKYQDGQSVMNIIGNSKVSSVTLYAQWLDITPPTGEIKTDKNSWKDFTDKISFDLFFAKTQTVSITASDNSNTAVKIEYLLSSKELTKAQLSDQTFTKYTGAFNINPDNEYIVYAKLTDTADNVTYISTNGIVLDSTAPVISGIENGKTYCSRQTVTVTEKYISSVTVNGDDITSTLDGNNKFVLSPAKGEQKIVVTDKAGNKSQMTVTVNDGHCGGTATCTDKAICDICGESYGELDSNNHSSLKHFEAKAATEDSEGNSEYWYCEGCNKYFGDKDCKNETNLADTVIAKLPKNNSPQTGDSSHTAIWCTLIFAISALLASTAVCIKKKRHFIK